MSNCNLRRKWQILGNQNPSWGQWGHYSGLFGIISWLMMLLLHSNTPAALKHTRMPLIKSSNIYRRIHCFLQTLNIPQHARALSQAFPTSFNSS
jgi:hypothetical protein